MASLFLKSTALSVIASLDLVLGLFASAAVSQRLFYFPTPLPPLLILLFPILFTPPPHFSPRADSIYPLSLSFTHCLSSFTASASPTFSQFISPLPPPHSQPPPFSLPLMYAFFISQFVSLPQPIFFFSPSLTYPPLQPFLLLSLSSSSPLYRPPPYIYSSVSAPRVSRRETSRAVVPAEQLPCKAIQIEMFAENNMCVITA